MSDSTSVDIVYYKKGFYLPQLHAEIPQGSVEITKDYWLDLLREQSLGYRIESDSTGYPVAVLPEDRPLSQLKEAAGAKLWRNYKTYQTVYVDAQDLVLATTAAAFGSQKGKSLQFWVMGLWQTYYTVKDLIQAAQSPQELQAVDISAERCGSPPYTIRQLNEEVMAYLESQSSDSASA